MKTDYEMLKEIADKIGFMKGDIHCWGCMAKEGLQYSSKTKGLDGKCIICGYEGEDIGLLSGNLENLYRYKRGSIKEIIFTREFIDKIIDYVKNNDIDIKNGDYINGWLNYLKTRIIDNVNNPLQYLYKLLDLGQKN